MNLNTPCQFISQRRTGSRPKKYIARRPNGNKVSESLTRWLWKQKYGPIPNGLFVCHGCDVGHCVNLEHLYLDTHQGNMRHAYEIGRLHNLQPNLGDLHPRRKVSSNQVLEIRARHAKGDSTRQLGADYGISAVQVRFIVTRRSWKHI